MVEQFKAKGADTGAQRPHILSVLGFFLVCIALLAALAGCQESQSSGRAGTVQTGPQDVTGQAVLIPQDYTGAGEPNIYVEKAVYDFGEVGPETVNSGKFTFTNRGTAPLKILQVKSCCGSVTRGVKRGQVYAPGESGTLEIDFRSTRVLGVIKRKLSIQTNDPDQEITSLTIKAKVVRRIAHDPENLKLFTKMDNAGAKDITLTSTDDKPFSVTGFRSTADAIDAEFDPSLEATKVVLKPVVDLDKLPRNRRGQISIDVTHPECKNIRISYDVLPEFTLDTSQIIIFKAKPGESVERHIWVISNYQDDFEIDSVSTGKEIVSIKNKEKVGNRYHLILNIVAPSPGEENETVVIDELEVKIKGGETLTARIRLFYS